jgi:uncharacterized protein YjaG (DUF416 family)
MKKLKILAQCDSLKGWREIAFIMSMTQRAWPNYVLYCESVAISGIIDINKMATMLDYLWQRLVEKKIEDAEDESECSAMLDRLYLNQQILSEQEAFGAQAALYVCELIEQVLLARINQERRRASLVREKAIEILSRFIQLQTYGVLVEDNDEVSGIDDNELVNVLDHHPLMKRELGFQRTLVQHLRASGSPSPKLMGVLRDMSRDDDVSNLGITIE